MVESKCPHVNIRYVTIEVGGSMARMRLIQHRNTTQNRHTKEQESIHHVLHRQAENDFTKLTHTQRNRREQGKTHHSLLTQTEKDRTKHTNKSFVLSFRG